MFSSKEGRGRGVAACDAKGAVRVDALVVRDVPEDFLQRPLPRRIGEAADTLLVQRLEEQDGLAPLGDEGPDRVVAGDEIDVGLRVGGDLVVAGASRDRR